MAGIAPERREGGCRSVCRRWHLLALPESASAPSIAANGRVTVSVDVTNSGGMDGDEVVQLYVARPGMAGAPVRVLQGFRRIHLARGETRRVDVALADRALSVVPRTEPGGIDPGQVDVWVGAGQPVARPGLARVPGVRLRFAVTGARSCRDKGPSFSFRNQARSGTGAKALHGTAGKSRFLRA
jgi:hypothetical protein